MPCGALRHFLRGDRAGVGGLCLHRGRRHQSVEGVGGFLPDLWGFSPRFRRDGLLVAAPERDDGRRIVIDGTSPILSCTLREDHYGVLTEVLVIDKTRNVSYSVQNRDMLDRGGQCRRWSTPRAEHLGCHAVYRGVSDPAVPGGGTDH